mgnify:CR=1 FL=1
MMKRGRLFLDKEDMTVGMNNMPLKQGIPVSVAHLPLPQQPENLYRGKVKKAKPFLR